MTDEHLKIGMSFNSRDEYYKDLQGWASTGEWGVGGYGPSPPRFTIYPVRGVGGGARGR
jgi:hypothetical protein